MSSASGPPDAAAATGVTVPELSSRDVPAPHACLLSNGRYTALLAGSGAGVSTCAGYALTSWSADRTEDGDGLVLYLRDLETGVVWSAGRQPVGGTAASYAARYECGRMWIERCDDGIETRLEVCVAPDADVEIRRLRLRNGCERPRRIEVTSYAEVVLLDPAAHAAHPAFAKLFVQTAYVPEHEVLLAWRRPRSQGEQHPWLMHALRGAGPLAWETDRVRFLGRGRTRQAPLALASTAALSGTTGSVLDPVFSLRRVAHLAPGESADLTLLLGVAPTREAALELAARYATAGAFDEVCAQATEHERACRERLGISGAQAESYQALAGALRYGHPALRAPAEIVARADGGLDTLWRYGIGDGLVAVVRVERNEDRALLAELLRANAYWRSKALGVKLVLLCGAPLADEAQAMLQGQGGGVTVDAVVLRLDEIPAAHVDLAQARANLVVTGTFPALGSGGAGRALGKDAAPFRPATAEQLAGAPALDDIALPNGFGGFGPDGSEYVVRVETDASGAARRPPMPWINVVANERSGFLVSESGAGYTWSRNSRENRLTPWHNDPIRDPHGEALYVRDEDAGVFWSPLPGPVPPPAAFEVRHGYGYTSWRHRSHDLEQAVTMFVPQRPPDPLKITRVTLTNLNDRPRRLSLFSYSRLVLGVMPESSGRFVVTERDPESGAILGRNRTNFEFRDGVMFAAAVTPQGAAVHCSADRETFIGREGSPAAPAALCRASVLDGRTGAGLDPCVALQVSVEVPPRGTVECAFLFGEVIDPTQARALIARYRSPGALEEALLGARSFWTELVSAVHIETPVPAIDLMVNGWLGYQALSCRIWGRSAFYQSGGAFGFRDQLQDAAALVHLRPSLTRAQIVLHATHQFVEGDVLHWWHPPTGRGIRTRFSDDLLWLPFLTAFYVRTTGDWGVLDESVGFLKTRALEPGEDEAYLVPEFSAEQADVYVHCCRALDRGLTRGQHGLPLMGTGDWNDGMNRVGREGRGESVWMGFFLFRIIDDFVPLCERRDDGERVGRYRAYQAELRAALEDAGWDGAWYRRAYYDDGTPLGSASNEECRIDALAQSWAVLSKAAPAERAAQAMDAAMNLLVSPQDGIIRLLTPPFDRDPHDPGYIKGYVPGIRENGGQYTHGALWVVQALAELGRRDCAAALLAMLSPVQRAATAENVAVYQVEPYVVAADVYGMPPHVGRGGWTWYTGAAGWMLRVALESVLGLRVEGGDTLWVRPCVPDEWPRFAARLRLPDGATIYEVTVRNPTGCAAAVAAVRVDGRPGTVEQGAARVPLQRDGMTHRVEITLAAGAS